MKKYIGTKTVMAQPMTEYTAVKKGLARQNVDNNWRQGYCVQYEDGYKSWSPKDVFEKSHRIAETPVDRLRIEFADVQERLAKLKAFLASDKGQELGSIAKGLLMSQAAIMENYMSALSVREAAMTDSLQLFNKFNFGAAIELLKTGLKLKRAGWKGNIELLEGKRWAIGRRVETGVAGLW